MRLIRNVMNWLYSAYCVITFFVVIFFLFLAYASVYFFNDRTRTLSAYKANRALTRVWLFICGFKLKVEGADKIDPTRTYVFVGNHCNKLDLPMTGFFLQHYYKSLAKNELRYLPLMGFLFAVTCVFVDRSNAESRRRSSQIIIDKLKQGVSFLIFPEGTRNKTGKPLKEFYGGAFKFAILAQVPIQPFVLLDHHSLQPVETTRFHPGTMRVKVLDAIDTTGMQLSDAAALQERVFKLLEAVILTEDKDFKK